jgi:hypothetical protein
LSNYRARYYDPSAGRFISEDPIGFNAKQANFYSYVSNSPANFADPKGLSAWSKAKNFMNCVDACAKFMQDLNSCTFKKNLKRAFLSAPFVAGGVCGVIVAFEPELAPAFVPCAALVSVSTALILSTNALARLGIENLSSGVGCTTFCAMNELK